MRIRQANQLASSFRALRLQPTVQADPLKVIAIDEVLGILDDSLIQQGGGEDSPQVDPLTSFDATKSGMRPRTNIERCLPHFAIIAARQMGFCDLRQPLDHGSLTVARLLSSSGLINAGANEAKGSAADSNHSFRQPVWRIMQISGLAQSVLFSNLSAMMPELTDANSPHTLRIMALIDA